MEILKTGISNNPSSTLIKSRLFQQIGTWILDVTTLKLTIDDDIIEMLKFIGFDTISSEDTLLEFSEKYIHPKDIEFVQSRYQEALKNRDVINYTDRFEYIVVGPDKSEYTILVKALILQPGIVTGSAQNITDVKTVESRFRNKEIGFRSVLNSSADYVFTVTQEGKFILWNDAYEFAIKKYFNKSLEVGMMASDILPEERQPEWLSVLDAANKGIETSLELYLDLGKRYYYNVVANPIKGIDETIQSISFWVQDITEKKLIIDIDRLESKVLGFAMQNPSIDNIFYLLLSGIENLVPTLKTYITTLNSNNTELNWKCTPRIPFSYLQAIPSIPIGPNVGSCGAAAYNHKPAYTKDIATSDAWKPFRDISLLNGFRACFSFPIINPQGVLIGTLGSYLNESRDLTTIELELLERGVKLTGLLLDRQIAKENATKKANQLAELSKFIPGVIYESKAFPSGDRKFTYVSERSFEFLGFSSDDFTKNYDLIWKCIHPDDIDIVKNSLILSFKLLTPWNCEFRAINFVNKKEKWLNLTAEHFKNDDGTFTSYGAIFDIQNQKESELVLQKSKDELSALISSIDDIVFEMCEGGKFKNVWTNDENRLAFPKEKFIGKKIEELFDNEKSSLYHETVKLVLETGKPQSFEYSMVVENTKYFYNATVGRIKSINEVNNRFYVSIKDITELKVAEKDSLDMHRILNEAGKLAKLGAFEFNTQTNEVMWSGELYSIFELSNSIKGVHLYDEYFNAVHPDDLANLRNLVERAIINGENYEIEHRIVMPNGNVKYISGRGNVVQDSIGKVISIFGVAQDITELKSSQLVIHEANEKYHSLFLNSGEAILLTSQDGTIYSANPEACKMFGRTEFELCENGRNGIVNIENPDIKNAINERKKTGFFKGELPFIRKDGSEFIGEISTSVFYNSNGEERTSMIIRDITLRKESEKIINDGIKEKEVLLAEIHHRVKNNLSIVSSLLQLQQFYTKDESIRMMVKESQNRLKSMALVHEKLYQNEDLSKINFKNYIQDLAEYIHTSYSDPSTNVKINTNAQNQNFDIATAVPCGLILNELLTNVYKYAFVDRNEGTIDIHFNKSGKYFMIQVSDNGVGLQKPINFDQPTTMGYTLLKSLTTQLKGTLEVKNNTTGGLSVIVTFPDTSSI